MKREFSPFHVAVALLLAGVTLRLLGNCFPEAFPNISPLMTIAYVGAMYLPRRWGWLVGPLALVLTDFAFVRLNYLTGGAGVMFSWQTLVSGLVYAAAGLFGIWIAHRKSLPKILGGSLVCSLVFYVAANTFSWWYDRLIGFQPAYPASWAGWWQANTVGLPGYEPTWMFLRNGMLGDLFFALVLLLILDRSLFFGQAAERAASRAA